MLFTYVIAGWEGTANDARILMETIANPDNDEMRRRGGPRGRKELFNFRHSSLRNVIERKQTSIVIACCALHNFIKIHAEDDKLFHEYENYEDEEGSTSGVELPLTEFNVSYAATREMTEKRDAIANQLWSDNHV
ncbi:unnamed protein product [Linum tenue]|uniref:DDE Tnp4 domain-containing protein n=1 Tax=Linum tenue TaxID=586396 RepID=A0AAV0HEB9_9ROSI|nr:unnamed protein product [Linum tenue]